MRGVQCTNFQAFDVALAVLVHSSYTECSNQVNNLSIIIFATSRDLD